MKTTNATTGSLPRLASQLWIMETSQDRDGYVDRFDHIKNLVLHKNGVTLELTSDETEQLYRHLKPLLAG